MPTLEHHGAHIHYSDSGAPDGMQDRPALLLFAPGGMKSAQALWANAPFDPREALADQCRIIAMDQRNAGASTAPIAADHGWHSYTDDHLALLDHLGIERAVVMGMCIGGPYCLALMARAPERVSAAVLLQPIGLDDNREAFGQMFDGWMAELQPARPDVQPEDWAALRSNMFDGDFVFSVSRDFVRGCETPMLVARGNDLYHPASVSEEIVALAPNAALIGEWKASPAREHALQRIRGFIADHG